MKKQNANYAIFIGVLLTGSILSIGVLDNSITTELAGNNENMLIHSATWFEGAILINSDSDFETYTGVGSGSDVDPWRIQGYQINATEGPGIVIKHTREYFVVEDCVIMNASYGIHLDNVSNGEFLNNTIYDCRLTGIFLEGERSAGMAGVHNIEINKNIIHDIQGTVDLSGNGIRLDWHCTNINIKNNTIFNNYGTKNRTGNGIYMEGFTVVQGCEYNIIENNLIYDNAGKAGRSSGNGIYMDYYCVNTEIKGNTIFGSSSESGILSGNGIGISQHCYYNLIENNTIYGNIGGTNGIPYMDGYSGNGITMLGDNDHTEILNNTIYGNQGGTGMSQGNGISVMGSVDYDISNNTIFGNIAGIGTDSGNGVHIQSLTDATITNNLIYENQGGDHFYTGNGILLSFNSHNSYIADNVIRDNIAGSNGTSGNGIILTNCDDSVIIRNEILRCTGESAESGSGIVIRVGNNFNVTYNTVDYCSNYGVDLGFSTNCNVSYNKFFGNGHSTCIYDLANNIITPNDCTYLGTTLRFTDNYFPGKDVLLTWTGSSWADYYYIFRSSEQISAENYLALVPIANVTATTFTDVLTKEGTFYYAIMAANASLNGTISNYMQTTYTIPPEGGGITIPFYMLPGILLAVVFILRKMCLIRKNR